ncbi:hypothetical protein FHX14_006041 [Rhizobium sp. BK619]|uniref:hypothetical protein n=1 Tax=Rhizobium sp. BK619 TaxID=2586989 RepID=UPI0018435872|nr:hypothetical protein [Rhizobium sp. BK619]MBB3649799.1 hypothetical protein [Rhizobium sp. BK619]
MRDESKAGRVNSAEQDPVDFAAIGKNRQFRHLEARLRLLPDQRPGQNGRDDRAQRQTHGGGKTLVVRFHVDPIGSTAPQDGVETVSTRDLPEPAGADDNGDRENCEESEQDFSNCWH